VEKLQKGFTISAHQSGRHHYLFQPALHISFALKLNFSSTVPAFKEELAMPTFRERRKLAMLRRSSMGCYLHLRF
jgi:hypothetical protein